MGQTKTNKSPVGLPSAEALGLVPIKMKDEVNLSSKRDTPDEQDQFPQHTAVSYIPAQARSLAPAPGWRSTCGSEQQYGRGSSTSSARGALVMQLRDERRRRMEA